MSEIYNIYCDESCHLENDHLGVMVLGAVWNPKNKSKDIARKIREIKNLNGLHSNQEIKWVKVSPNKKKFYIDLVEYFFSCPDLHFRAVLVPNKDKLCHKVHKQTHDSWYYKMYFVMLRQIFCPNAQYNIYLDIKDTFGGQKICKLHNVLCNSMYDFSQSVVKNVQLVRSHEVEQVQLADLFIGAVSYLNREHFGSKAKLAVINRIKSSTNYDLKHSTLLKEDKFNILRWVSSGEIDNE
jgi:hypothetical protein